VNGQRIETIRVAAEKVRERSRGQYIVPEYTGLAHYTERQVREYARGIGLYDTYLYTVSKEREG
jgi:hypothetical protein